MATGIVARLFPPTEKPGDRDGSDAKLTWWPIWNGVDPLDLLPEDPLGMEAARASDPEVNGWPESSTGLPDYESTESDCWTWEDYSTIITEELQSRLWQLATEGKQRRIVWKWEFTLHYRFRPEHQWRWIIGLLICTIRSIAFPWNSTCLDVWPTCRPCAAGPTYSRPLFSFQKSDALLPTCLVFPDIIRWYFAAIICIFELVWLFMDLCSAVRIFHPWTCLVLQF